MKNETVTMQIESAIEGSGGSMIATPMPTLQTWCQTGGDTITLPSGDVQNFEECCKHIGERVDVKFKEGVASKNGGLKYYVHRDKDGVNVLSD